MNQWSFLRNVLIKATLLLLIVNFLAMGCDMGALGRISLYNSVIPGRERLPFGENPLISFNLSLYNLDAMIASHRISSGKALNEFRVVILGDSSVWGLFLKPEETLAGRMNSLQLRTCQGQPVAFYNLGYPSLSLTKDLLILDAIRPYHPDLVIWMVTLEAFPLLRTQLESPLPAHNPQRVRALIGQYGLPINPEDPAFDNPSWWQRTLIGRRREFADLIRLQLLGGMWAATGIDEEYPTNYARPQLNFNANDTDFHKSSGPTLEASGLGFDILEAGVKIASPARIIFVNEPIVISKGQNSQIRYNLYYPRWAYDQYRVLLANKAAANGWVYSDVWNLIQTDEFSNSGIHLTPTGEEELAHSIQNTIRGELCR